MRIEQLLYLVETARAASINKASERLHITQQSLNASLTKLEDELGVTLLIRNSFGVTLTEQGEKAVAYAEDILQKADEMKHMLVNEQASAARDQLKGHLEISAGPLFNHGPLPEALRRVRQEHKQVRLSLIERENLDMIKALLNNEPRLFLMSVLSDKDREFAMLDLQKLFYRHLGRTRIYAIASIEHPLARQKSITVRTMLKYPLAIFQASEKAPNPTLSYLATIGKVQVAVQTNNMVIYRQYIDTGEVIGVSPQFANKQINKPRKGTILLPIKDFPTADAVCVADREYYRKNHSVIDLFLDHLAAYMNGEK